MARHKIALGTIPKAGGTFTFYRNLRPQLGPQNMDVYSVTVGAGEAALVDKAFMDDGCVVLAEVEKDLMRQSQAFAKWCDNNKIDIVIAINSEAIMSAIPHLAQRIRIVSRVASIFDSGYQNVMSGYERGARIVTTAPRQQKDLAEKYGVFTDRMILIPNGIEPTPYTLAASAKRGCCNKLRLGFLGRLEHISKGVLFIPKILKRLRASGVPFHLSIAGKGVYEKGLKRILRRYVRENVVEFIGELSPEDVPSYLSSVDVLLFTSQSEGCPNTLLEALMAGCVPIVWRIEGTTDFIIDDGRTGFICPLGDCDLFSERIGNLANDREFLGKMSRSCAEEARQRFSQSRLGDDYGSLFREIMAQPCPEWMPLGWDEFKQNMPERSNTSLHDYAKAMAKKYIRRSLYGLRLSQRYE